MEAFKIEILNPKALKLIKGMQDLNLIRLTEQPASTFKAYLKKMRSKSVNAPSMEEISALVQEVRSSRYAKK